jgi:hypothetical protein
LSAEDEIPEPDDIPEPIPEVGGSHPSHERRKLFRRLVALAGLGITGVLLSQDKTGLLPRVAATSTSVTTDSAPNTAGDVAFWDSTSGGADITSDSNFTWDSSLGLSSKASNYGVQGVSSGTGVGVYGNVKGSGGFGIQADTTGAGIPLNVTISESATATILQQWENTISGAILGQVDVNGNFDIDVSELNGGSSLTPGIIFGDSGSGEGISSNRSSGIKDLEFWTNHLQRMTVSNAGNVGIGTTSPGGVLDVEGSTAILFPSIVSHHGLVNSEALGIFQQWDVQFQDLSTANRVSAQLLRFTYVRNPGAGIPTVYDAMVNLTPLINDNLAGELRGFQVDGPTVASGKTLSTFKAINVSAPSGTVTNNYALITQPGSGNVGIGTNSPSHLIELSGGAYSDGSTWNNASSVRWKENIEPLTDGVTALKQLHPVAYNYKRTPEKRTMGFIAEEIGKVLPSVVDWDKAEAGYAEGYDHVAILALAVQAIKEQQSKIQQLEKLQERIAALERKMN